MSCSALDKDIHGKQYHPHSPEEITNPLQHFQKVFSELLWNVETYRHITMFCSAGLTHSGGKQIEKNRGEKKKTRKDLPFTFNCDMKIQAMETAYAGGNRRGHSPLGGETWAYPCRIENQTGVSGVSGSISSNKKVHRQCKKRRWIHRSCWDRNFW